MPLTSEILDTHPLYCPIQQASRCQKFKICISRFQTVFRAQCWLTSLRHAFGLIEKSQKSELWEYPTGWLTPTEGGCKRQCAIVSQQKHIVQLIKKFIKYWILYDERMYWAVGWWIVLKRWQRPLSGRWIHMSWRWPIKMQSFTSRIHPVSKW